MLARRGRRRGAEGRDRGRDLTATTRSACSFDLDEPRQRLDAAATMTVAEVDLRAQPDADAALDAFCGKRAGAISRSTPPRWPRPAYCSWPTAARSCTWSPATSCSTAGHRASSTPNSQGPTARARLASRRGSSQPNRRCLRRGGQRCASTAPKDARRSPGGRPRCAIRQRRSRSATSRRHRRADTPPTRCASASTARCSNACAPPRGQSGTTLFQLLLAAVTRDARAPRAPGRIRRQHPVRRARASRVAARCWPTACSTCRCAWLHGRHDDADLLAQRQAHADGRARTSADHAGHRRARAPAAERRQPSAADRRVLQPEPEGRPVGLGAARGNDARRPQARHPVRAVLQLL